MQIQDMVKLIYQSQFGGGHLIRDPRESLERLLAEYEALERDSGTAGRGIGQKDGGEDWSCVEPAGGGMCRVKLAALDLGLSAGTLNRMFVRSAEEVKGSERGMREGLEILLSLCGKDISLDRGEAESYIRGYEAKGCPAVSHSQAYREAYRPAYRIVNAMYGRFLPLFARIDRLLTESAGRTVNIAVDGMSGSGKSTLAKLLTGIYGCNVFHMDDFFLQPFQRVPERFREPGGNVDYERFKEQVIDHLSDKGGVEYQVYDCGRQELAERVFAPHCRMNLIEGSYSQHPYFGNCYDLRVFLEVDEREQRERIRRRNGEFMLRRFTEEWIPMENAYFAAYHIRENSCERL